MINCGHIKTYIKPNKMKTLKFISAIIVFIFSVFPFSNNLKAQDVDLVTCLSCKDLGKGRIYFSPFNLIAPGTSSFQLTYGKAFLEAFEIQISAGQIISSDSQFQFRKDAHRNRKAKVEGGYRIGAEIQGRLLSYKRAHFYVGLEHFLKSGNYSRPTNKFDYSSRNLRTGTEFIKEDTKGFNFKVGLKSYLRKRLLLESYVGFSSSFRTRTFTNNINDKVKFIDKNYFGESLRGWTIPWNVKIGYDF